MKIVVIYHREKMLNIGWDWVHRGFKGFGKKVELDYSEFWKEQEEYNEAREWETEGGKLW